ncbi:MAG: glycosyltransferase [Muribaculum sp.]|nr:glycosyltransferase [Muribaculum sp.]
MEKKKVLIIPDASQGKSSGATVCQVAQKLCLELGHDVYVFTEDIEADFSKDNVTYIKRESFSSKANYFPKKYLDQFRAILFKYGIETLFFLGSITNKPLCYLEEGLRRHLNICVKIFMQDFFCSKFYANDDKGVCVKCLNGQFANALHDRCCGSGLNNKLVTLNRIQIRKRLKKLLPQTNYIITSSDQQVGFYNDFGIPAEKCIKTPLYFNGDRFKGVETFFGNYYIGIAQHRLEKGFHLLPSILKYSGKDVKVVLAYANNKQVEIAKKNPEFKPYIDSGQLEIIVSSWNSGLMDLVTNAKGVIIPSIWPTTTEYGLLESLALGKCVFCFNIGIHGEIIQNGVNGFAFSVNENEEFADKLTTFSNIEYTEMRQNIDNLYQSLTDWDGWIKTLKKIL